MGEIENVFGQIRKLEEDINKTADQISQNPGDESLLNRLYRLQHEFEAREAILQIRSHGYSDIYGFRPWKVMTRRSRLCPAEKGPGCLWQRLLEKPDVLVLDEPTNHLDIGMLKWLEQYLSSYKGSMTHSFP